MKSFISKLNYEYLYATCLVFDTKYKEHITDAIEIQKKKQSLKVYKIYFYIIQIWCQRIYHHLRNNISLLLPWLSNKEGTRMTCMNTIEVAEFNDSNIKKMKLDNTKILFND